MSNWMKFDDSSSSLKESFYDDQLALISAYAQFYSREDRRQANDWTKSEESHHPNQRERENSSIDGAKIQLNQNNTVPLKMENIEVKEMLSSALRQNIRQSGGENIPQDQKKLEKICIIEKKSQELELAHQESEVSNKEKSLINGTQTEQSKEEGQQFNKRVQSHACKKEEQNKSDQDIFKQRNFIFQERISNRATSRPKWAIQKSEQLSLNIKKIDLDSQQAPPAKLVQLAQLEINLQNLLQNPDLNLRELNVSQNLDEVSISTILTQKWNGIKPIHLILDLDATLVHAVEVQRLPQNFRLNFKPGIKGCFEINFQLARQYNGKEIYTKQKLIVFTRPYAVQFIKKARKFCNIYLYTHGRRQYAQAVLQVLDPKGSIFSQVVALEKDEPDGVKKSTNRMNFTPQMKEMTVIVDDQFHAWRDIDKELLVMSSRYIALLDSQQDMIKYFIPQNPLHSYQERQNFHQQNKNSQYSQLPALQLYLQKLYVLISKKNLKIKELGLRIQSEIFKGVKFMTEFISVETKAFFETLITEMGGIIKEKEEEAEIVLTNFVEVSKDINIISKQKAHCKNFVMQGYLLKKRPPASHFQTNFI